MENKTICDRVKEIREQYGLIGTAVDPLIIAQENGIKILEKSNLTINGEPVSGAIIKKNNDITIYVNAEDSKVRKRFTVAHEIAHYYLHLDKNKQFVDLKRNNSKAPMELEADEFAGCLLMDTEHVNERYEKAKSIGLSNEGIVSVLAGIFVVSDAAMYTRLKNLGKF
ncbi:ImmA/IrrE family metallo-endopeptidase [Clostridium sp. YIM B02505]|uniref:ImmA/IrrE family metallo-endopeptidase n=1 Tax=Clostridium yunnanense TaxID=2800325 RepID=A0ABS1EIF6_9CLOT|nr:ImmA/IrrE family metallo-endopeptidase [Clostridium yunnanense]MBK1809130.1 ImmA/IrrE family metallo-endopeptidase [Clostridium yunnanense]